VTVTAIAVRFSARTRDCLSSSKHPNQLWTQPVGKGKVIPLQTRCGPEGGYWVLFRDRGTRRGWVVSSTPRPHFAPGKDPVSNVQEAGWAPGPVWTGGKSRRQRDSIPDRPARSQSLYRLSYPAHAIQSVPGDISVEVKRAESEAGLSAASNEVMNEWNSTSIPPCTFMTRTGTTLPMLSP